MIPSMRYLTIALLLLLSVSALAESPSKPDPDSKRSAAIAKARKAYAKALVIPQSDYLRTLTTQQQIASRKKDTAEADRLQTLVDATRDRLELATAEAGEEIIPNGVYRWRSDNTTVEITVVGTLVFDSQHHKVASISKDSKQAITLQFPKEVFLKSANGSGFGPKGTFSFNPENGAYAMDGFGHSTITYASGLPEISF